MRVLTASLLCVAGVTAWTRKNWAAGSVGRRMVSGRRGERTTLSAVTTAAPPTPAPSLSVSEEQPLHVIIAGAGVGGLTLANALTLANSPHVKCTVLERTKEFKRFGGPIQLASNALENIRSVDDALFKKVEAAATWTGNRTNGIKDGIRSEWYAKFDLGTPAKIRNMPYTCVVDRPDLQNILLEHVHDQVQHDAAVATYETSTNPEEGVTVTLESGEVLKGDVLIGADGIWSAVRASMRDEPAKGDGSGVAYSGYTVFAGELEYDSPDAGDVGYKVYIGPGQYFVITDIGRGRYQWYAFLAREPDSEANEPKPDGAGPYLTNLFKEWSPEIHAILSVTKEHEIEQRDLYDRPPSVLKSWKDHRVVLMGDSVHAMMPNLGQGGCQAIEDAKVLSEELLGVTSRSDVDAALQRYVNRRRLRSAAVQGLSRFASDIIIRGFDTPCKIVTEPSLRFENFNYAGIVTRLLQPFLPIFFSIQFNFLYSGYKNEPFNLEPIRDIFILGPSFIAGGLALDALLGGEAFEAMTAAISEWSGVGESFTDLM